MDQQFHCQSADRRLRLRADASPPSSFNGIDYIEVLDSRAAEFGVPRQKALLVHFFKEIPDTLNANNVRIESDADAAPVNVTSAFRSDSGSPPFWDRPETLVVLTDSSGDYSIYTLKLAASPTSDEPPDDFDLVLSEIDFSFKVECPSDFDCRPNVECPPDLPAEPEIDYLAKDYSSFRRLILDRLSVVAPDWKDRSAADLQIALVEILAYIGDYLSYYQDSVSTETYLHTARQRASVRRHTRMLDYFMHDGCNSRTWVHLSCDVVEKELERENVQFRTGGDDDADLVFAPLHDVTLRLAHNRIRFYTWGDSECCLPKGSTRATLMATSEDSTPQDVVLEKGEILIFEEVLSPTKGNAEDADPTRRAAVRLTSVEESTDTLTGEPLVEIEWHEEDALPFALCLSARVTDANDETTKPEPHISVARGNIVLADNGTPYANESLAPDPLASKTDYRPRLRRSGVTFAVPEDPDDLAEKSASASIRQDPRDALPDVVLTEDGEPWTPLRDLLNSDRFAPEFVVETSNDGRAHIRFGDNVRGKRPAEETKFNANYRVGNGPEGNLGAEAIVRAVDSDGAPVAGVSAVRNPLPATGGSRAETMEEARQYAPQAFRVQQRAVTEADYAEVAERHVGVQKAVANFRWTGSWHTVFLNVDRTGGFSSRDDDEFRQELHDHVERFRLAGYDLEINDPIFVPLEILIDVCVKDGFFQGDIKQQLRKVFSNSDHAAGSRGFFHPDNWTFGQPLYLSRIYRAAISVEGVASVQVKTFKRFRKLATDELEEGVLETGSLEIIQLDNDPSAQENGKIEFRMFGGL